MPYPYHYFNSSPDANRETVMMYIPYLLSLGWVEDLLPKGRIDTCHETART